MSGHTKLLYIIIAVLIVLLGYNMYSSNTALAPHISDEGATTTESSVQDGDVDKASESDTATTATEPASAPPPTPQPSNPSTPTPPPVVASTHKTFNITAWNYEYSTTRMDVKVGDTVTINLTSLEDYQDIWIDDYRIDLSGVKPGKPGTITFTADEAGVFKFYSKVGNNRQQGMEGLFVVSY